MKFTNTVIIDPITTEPVKANGKDLTTGRAAASALLQAPPKGGSPAAIFDAHDLAMKLANANKSVEIDARQKELIEQAVPSVWTPLVAAPTLRAIAEK